MICNSCGRNSSNENANFCDYCGASLKNTPSSQNDREVTADTGYHISKVSVDSAAESGEKPTSFLNWLGSLLLPFIPFIGPIIYFVMLLVWAFSSDTNRSKKNWARAMLIVIVISIVIIVVFFTSAVMGILNSGMDLNSYMDEYYKQFY